MSTFSHKKKTPAQVLTRLSLAIGVLITASCSAVSVEQKNSSQTIEKQRGNIVTKNSLSNKSASVLVSMGVPADTCLSDFDTCINKIEQGVLNRNSRESLALYAEVYLAKAKKIAASDDCVQRILRPPIDPYYANAPLDEEGEMQLMRHLRECNTSYRDNLLNAIKYSYAYLFYAQLAPDRSSSDQVAVKPNNLPTDLDIQTQDVYEAATDYLIKQLYANRNHSQQVAKVTSYLGTELKELNTAAMYDNMTLNGMPYGEQIKVLNFTFPPIEDDKYFKNITQSNAKDGAVETVETAIADASSQTTSIDLYLPNEPEYLQNTKSHNKSINQLYASHDLSFSGLNTISEREGFGVSYVTLFEDRLNTSVKGLLTSDMRSLNSENPKDRIHLTGNLLLTSIIMPKGNTLDEVLNSYDFDVKLYNPHHTEMVNILGNDYYLGANFSASYGMWLAENRLNNVGYFNLLAKQQALTLPQLFMLEPYDPNKRIIIMLHGLASSPATWVSVTNDISNDPSLRDNYQVWQIFYPTNIPILENRYRIQQLIETTYQMNDPKAEHIASKNSVLIGHSMGAVIGRMLVSNENLEQKFEELSKHESDRHLNKLLESELDRLKVNNRLHLNKLDSVDTAVFISAPFRGTDFADRWFTQLLRSAIQLPIGFAQTIKGNLTSIATEGELTANPMGALYFENGASQLSDKSSFMKLTADLPIADDVTYHSIIANRDSDIFQGLMKLRITSAPKTELYEGDLPTPELETKAASAAPDLSEQGAEMRAPETLGSLKDSLTQSLTPNLSDGIVPYSSSHLEGAESETIISGGHGIHETPEAVLTLRKILYQHLNEHPLPK